MSYTVKIFVFVAFLANLAAAYGKYNIKNQETQISTLRIQDSCEVVYG